MRKPKEFKAFEDLVKRVLAVPKKEIDKREVEYKKARKRPRPKSSTSEH
jgi:hypothetical protein